MNRQTRLLIVIGIAVVVAGLASIFTFILARGEGALDVVAAKRPLQPGVRLTNEDVYLIKWPKNATVAGSKGDIKDVIDRCLLVAVSENDPVTETKLAKPEQCGLSTMVKPGMLGMSVKVNEVVGVAGFVVPGTHVDVIVTLRSQRGDSSTSRVVVRNVQVLAAGTSYDEIEAQKAGKPISTSVVTLMVSPEEAQKIALAGNDGVITLALRNPADTREGLPSPTTTPDLLVGDTPTLIEPPPRGPDDPKPAPPRLLTVRVTSPKSGGALTGATDLTASVAGVTGGVAAQWKIDGVDFGPELNESPFSLRWDTSRLPDGAHSATIAVRDGSGKTATSTITATIAGICEKFVNGERKDVPCVR